MIRTLTVVWSLFALLVGSTIFVLKDEVKDQEARLRGLHQTILSRQESIHVLRAEWSYLNRPDQLAKHAGESLALVPLTAKQIRSFDSLPEPSDDPMPFELDAPSLLMAKADPAEPGPAAARVPAAHGPATHSLSDLDPSHAEGASSPASIEAILAQLTFEQ